jgi:hypothetical protein
MVTITTLVRGHLGLDPLCGLQPVHLGHPHVHEDEVGAELSARLQGLLAVVGLSDDLESLLAGEHGPETFPYQGVVVR